MGKVVLGPAVLPSVSALRPDGSPSRSGFRAFRGLGLGGLGFGVQGLGVRG